VIHKKLPLNAHLSSITVSSMAGKWFASVNYQSESATKNIGNAKIAEFVGNDLGLDTLNVTSDGRRFENPRCLQKRQKQLKRQQRHLSRCQRPRKNRDSKRYRKVQRKVQCLHLKIASTRKYTVQQIAFELVKNDRVIGFEDLNIPGMLKNHTLAKSISDASWGLIKTETIRLARKYGRQVILINPFFPSSKICNPCGFKLDSLPLTQREWRCPHCHALHDRDLNAAKNVRDETIKIFRSDVFRAGRGRVNGVEDAELSCKRKGAPDESLKSVKRLNAAADVPAE
jgi:putative transposase